MVKRVSVEDARSALSQRMRSVAAVLLPESSDETELSDLIGRLVRDFRSDDAALWLILVALAASMPSAREFLHFRRRVQTAEPGLELIAALEGSAGMAGLSNHKDREIRILSDAVAVDVNFCAKHGHNTGVQRVVRETTKQWVQQHAVHLLAWTADGVHMRDLTKEEESRVVEWTSSRRLEVSDYLDDALADLVVPWRTTLLLPEVAQEVLCESLAAMAQYSGNRIIIVGHDTIPVTSAPNVLPPETERFAKYLNVVKHADVVVGVSAAAASEFHGFAAAVSGQGLPGPFVTHVPLPIDAPTFEDDPTLTARDKSVPLVLCVGSLEPRKNQVALISAAEQLWARGLEFDLLFIGGNAGELSTEFDLAAARVQRGGWPLFVPTQVSDAVLHRAYLDARVSVLVSTHEGFGLPIGEALAQGLPVLTSNYGSMAEIAAGGGCLTVDPRDDDAIADALEQILVDDDLHARLVAEARGRANRTWQDYAEELWAIVVAPREHHDREL